MDATNTNKYNKETNTNMLRPFYGCNKYKQIQLRYKYEHATGILWMQQIQTNTIKIQIQLRDKYEHATGNLWVQVTPLVGKQTRIQTNTNTDKRQIQLREQIQTDSSKLMDASFATGWKATQTWGVPSQTRQASSSHHQIATSNAS